MTTARVELWGSRIGAVSWDADEGIGFFEYEPEFLESGIEVAPLKMPLARRIYSFPALARTSFHGLPGMLADVLPDRFGNALIEAWLAAQGRTPESFNPVERLAYTGARGIGALTFAPTLGPGPSLSEELNVGELVALATAALTDREGFAARLAEGDSTAVADLLRVGTSAGGARAKAVVAWNPATGELRSGQVDAGPGFSHWLLKFDGVSGNHDRELDDPQGFGRVEYAYHRMALAAGIEMTECRLLEENGRAHFMTRRFDRTAEGTRLHQQSLSALAHLDFDLAGAHSYEVAMLVLRQLDLPMRAIEEQFRRAVFNITARNQDDHVKNIAFLMDKGGSWYLSPAFDVTYAYNPSGLWTGRHQMSLNGKRDDFARADLEAFGKAVALKRGCAAALIDEVREAVAGWARFAEEAGVDEATAARIAATHRLQLS